MTGLDWNSVELTDYSIAFGLGRFDLVRKLGQGTYGKVQLGINKETGQEVLLFTLAGQLALVIPSQMT